MKRKGKSTIRQRITRFQKAGRSTHEVEEIRTTRTIPTTSRNFVERLAETDDDDWAEDENELIPMLKTTEGETKTPPSEGGEEPLLTFEDFARIARGADSASADARVFERVPWIVRKLFEISGTRLFRNYVVSQIVLVGDEAMSMFDEFGREDYLRAANHWYTRALYLTPTTGHQRILPLLRLCVTQHRAAQIAIADDDVLDSAIGGFECCRDLILRYGSTGFCGWWKGSDPGLTYWLGLRAGLSRALCELGYAHLTRFLRVSNLEDAKDAVGCLRQGITKYQTNLDSDQILQFGNALLTHYYAIGNPQDLDECIKVLSTYADRKATSGKPISDANLIKCLAEAFCARAECYCAESDARMSLAMSQRALSTLPTLTDDNQGWLRAGFTESLSRSLLVLASLSKDSSSVLETVNEAVNHFREALEMRKLAGAVPRHLGLTRSEFGIALLQKFRVTRNLDDLNSGISELRAAEKELRKANDVDKAVVFSNLGIAYRLKSLASADAMDINLSVVYLRKSLRAVESSSAQHNIKATYLSNLASSLLTRYRLRNLSEDLEESVQRAGQAVELVPSMHTLRFKALGVYCVCINERSSRLGDIEGLWKAVDLMREVLSATTVPFRDQTTYTINLAAILVHLANKTYAPAEANNILEEAIGLWRSIKSQVSPNHYLYLEILGGLADALFQKFITNEDPDLLTDVVDLRAHALELVSEQSSDILKYRKALADGLIARYRAYTHGNPADLEAAVGGYSTAVKYTHCPQSIRYACGVSWVNICVKYGHPSAMEAFEFAVEMYRRLAFVDSGLASRVDQLSMHDTGIAGSAARFAIERGEFERAIELLEHGRAAFWQQHVAPRAAITKLQNADPHLARRMAACWQELEECGSQDLRTARTDEWEQLLAADYQNRKLVELSAQWEDLVKEAEVAIGPIAVLQRRSFLELRSSIGSRLVVIISASSHGCDALILAPHLSAVERLELPSLTMGVLAKIRNKFDSALNRWGRSAGHHTRHFVSGDRKSVSAGNGAMYEVLRIVWNAVVKPVLELLKLEPKPLSERPRVWWLLTGSLSQIPLHAAGPYNDPTAPNAGSYAINSYIPTLSVLSTSAGHLSISRPKSIVVLAVAVPQVSYEPVKSIPATRNEVESIKTTLESAGAQVTTLIGDQATSSKVLQCLSSSTIAHFACHGMQDTYNPIQSALLLYDEALPLTRIATNIAHTSASPVVVLSACSTARGDINLLDESLHIAAAFIFIGFQAAVATLWSIEDRDALLVFREFYSYLCEQGTGGINLDETSRALSHALEVLRNSGVELERWLPFIHLGG